MQRFHIIPAGAPSSAPKIGSVREKLLRMREGLSATARTGGGLGSGDIDELTSELGTIIDGLPANTGTRNIGVAETIALAFADIDEAQAALDRAKNGLRASLGEDEADTGAIANRALTSAMALCIRAQSTLGAARIART